jgi:hypothetical protein
MKKYNVIWEESHKVVVEAETKEQAIDLVMQGYGSDDSSEITSPAEAFELLNK